MTTKLQDMLPKIPPAAGAETAKLVLKLIREFPYMHDQSDWVIGPGFSDHASVTDAAKHCSTTLCVAGWVALIHEPQVEWHASAPIERAGMRGLGISFWQASRLFYDATNDEAIEALQRIAEGHELDMETIIHAD